MNLSWYAIMTSFALATGSSCQRVNDSSSVRSGLIRPKRIVGGDSMTDRDEVPYKVVEYYVWIGDVWNCYEDHSTWNKVGFGLPGFADVVQRPTCTEKPENLVCGGALIAPAIVQTACHCMVTFIQLPDQLWGGYQLLNHFEEQKQIYMGKLDVLQFDHPIRSEKFAPHPRCGKLQVKPSQSKTRYDIGWLILAYEVPYLDGVVLGTWGQLDYAGPYRQQDIMDKYKQVISQRQVCLMVGFGENERGEDERYMKQAWIQIVDYIQCYQVTHEINGHEGLYTYNNSASWVCAQQMPAVSHNKFRGSSGNGDSGSPVTCDNNYFALVYADHKFKRPLAGFKKMLYQTAIAYALEANSVEQRRNFERLITDDVGLPTAVSQGLSTTKNPELRILHPTQKQPPKFKYTEFEKGSA